MELFFFQGSTTQQAELINKLQSLSKLPLLISADYERGTSMRLEEGSQFPNNMGVGATGDTNLAYEMGYVIGLECRALGVHQNYAPVMDVNNNPDNPIINVRSFGQDPKLVSDMGTAMIRGLQDARTMLPQSISRVTVIRILIHIVICLLLNLAVIDLIRLSWFRLSAPLIAV